MLYLVRKLNESIIVNNDIEIKIIEIKKNSVKIGVTFPADASVLRKELFEKIKNENIGASVANFEDADTITLDLKIDE